MIAKGGASLLEQSAIQAMREQLLPLADVLTPNLPEAEALIGLKAEDQHSITQIAECLQQMGAKTVIIKGGHQQNSESALCQDFIFTPTASFVLESPRFNTPHTHGTGCTFSACLTAELAKGQSLEQACKPPKPLLPAPSSTL